MGPSSGQPPRVAFVLGKPLRDASVLAEVRDKLRDVPVQISVHLPKGDVPMPDWLFDADLVVQRGLGLPELTSALRLERAGVRCCNRLAATIALRDRMQTVRTLADAGVPVPASASVTTWPAVVERADGQPVVVKAVDGSTGRGRGVLIAATGSLPAGAPFAGPYMVQEYIRSDEWVYKVYVAGRHAQGLVKRWPPRQAGSDEPNRPFTVDAELTDLSRLVGTVLDVEIHGVDVLYGPNGPVVVDVNPFPGFRGVPRAAALVARHLTAIATG